MKFKELYEQYIWRSIRNCPGRYVLLRSESVKFGDFYKTLPDISTYDIPDIHDRVQICYLEDGGLISYKKEDGFILHTLGDAFGFRKKLDELGFDLNPKA